MTCPVCAYTALPYPPNDYNICPCCGTEFGNDDSFMSHEELRRAWIAQGARWFFGQAPMGWNPYLQLIVAGLAGDVPKFSSALTIRSDGHNQASKISNVHAAVQPEEMELQLSACA